jgi:hypothetical protein
MVHKLGEIKKPRVKDFLDSKKLFCLPLVPQLRGEKVQENLESSINLFWKQASKQIGDLERSGRVSYIFFESITEDGEAGLDKVKQISEQCYGVVKEKMEQGAKLVTIEDDEVLNEFVDWSICLSLVQRSKKVFNKVLEFYNDVAKRRWKELAQRIDYNLKQGEAALLVMTEENRLQVQSHLSSDIQVFLIHPPALNDIQRWFRDYLKKQSTNN